MKSECTHKNIFWGYDKISNIFLGMPDMPIFFWGTFETRYFFGVNSRCWVQAYVCMKIESNPPGCVHSEKICVVGF